MMRFKEVALSNASPEAKIAGLAVLLDKELLRLSEVVLNTKKLQGPQGEQGLQGPKGEQGGRGFDGTNGKDGSDGKDGKDGHEGKDGVGVQDAKIDFDGSLVITLTNGREINAGDVVPEGVADKIKVIKSGGGNSQTVLDAIEEIQATIATYGTMATQNADAVAITGGSINGTTIGAAVPTTGVFTTLTATALTATGQTSLGGAAGSESFRALTGSSWVNYVQAQGATTGNQPFLWVGGANTNIALGVSSKGNGNINFFTNGGGNAQLVAAHTASAVNYVQVTGAATTKATVISSAGSDSNISSVFQSKGTGAIDLAAGSSGVNISNGGTVTAITRTAGGTGYATAPTVAITAPTTAGGVQATATVAVSAGAITTFTITNAGSGYVEQPTVSFSGGGGSGAAAYAVVGAATTIKGIGGNSNTSILFATAGGGALSVSDSGRATVDYWDFIGSSGSVGMRVAGATANNNGIITSKGTGYISLQTNAFGSEALRATHTASAVNYVQVTGAATGNNATISAQGSDANVGLTLQSKGTFGFQFRNSSNGIVGSITHGGSSTPNYIQLGANIAGQSAFVAASGTDANIDLTFFPKGTGNVRFGTYTANMALTVQGYIEIKDSGGTVRKLAVIA